MKVSNIDDLLGTPARLAVVLTLADNQPWTFTALRNETGLADGNLHVQARKLVAAEYLVAEKVKQGNRLVTAFRLSPLGRDKMRAYVGLLSMALGVKEISDISFKRDKKVESCHNDDSQVW